MSKLSTIFFLVGLVSGTTVQAQSCKPESIPASTPTTQFTVLGNGIVRDTKTGLMWQQCSLGQSFADTTCSGSASNYTWRQALQAADAFNQAGGFAGFTDWRIPNLKELASILERQCQYPSINLAIFPTTADYSGYWSASVVSPLQYGAMAVLFTRGQLYGVTGDDTYHVRLVRGG